MRCYKKNNQRPGYFQRGITLLETTMVVSVFSFLAASSLRYYGETKADADRLLLYSAFNRFSSAVVLVQVLRVVEGHKNDQVDYSNTPVYLNEHGWPANTMPSLSAASNNQTPFECQQLWEAFLHNPPPALLEPDTGKNDSEKKSTDKVFRARYLISSVNGTTCRYQMISNSEKSYYFDYSLKTGKVILHL